MFKTVLKRAWKIVNNIIDYLKQKALYNKALGLAYKHAYKWNKVGADRVIRHIRNNFRPNVISEKDIAQLEKYLLTRK